MDELGFDTQPEVIDMHQQQQQTEPPEQNTTGEGEQQQQQQEGQQKQQQEQPQTFKIKFNHEEKELTYDEIVQLSQKGMNYDKVYERYQQIQSDPRLSFVESLAKEYNMSPEQYIQAVHQQREQEKLNQLIQQNIPPEMAQEIMENRKFREAYEQQQRQLQEQQKRQEDYKIFLDEYPDVNPSDIPAEVWQEVETGKSLLDAYRIHENKLLKEQLAKYTQQEQSKQSNMKNAQTSPGSVTGQGDSDTGFYTKEQVEQMSPSDVKRNYSKIMQSMKFWK